MEHFLNRIILGTAQLGLKYGVNNSGDKPDLHSAIAILHGVHEQGIRSLDTSEGYGDAHLKIRNALKDGLSFKVFTKFVFQESDDLFKATDRILFDLGVKSIECLSFHRYSDYLGFSSYEQSAELKKQGKIKKLGVSVYGISEMERCLTDTSVDVIQFPFNVLDCDAEKIKLIKKLKASGKTIHIRSVFLQGLFMKPLDQFPPGLAPLLVPIREVHQIAQSLKLSVHALTLAFPFLIPEIDGVIIGLDGLPQLAENISILKATILPSDLLQKLHALKPFDRQLLNPSQWEIK